MKKYSFTNAKPVNLRKIRGRATERKRACRELTKAF